MDFLNNRYKKSNIPNNYYYNNIGFYKHNLNDYELIQKEEKID